MNKKLENNQFSRRFQIYSIDILIERKINCFVIFTLKRMDHLNHYWCWQICWNLYWSFPNFQCQEFWVPEPPLEPRKELQPVVQQPRPRNCKLKSNWQQWTPNYRTRAIITRGLYTFYTLFKVQNCFFKGLFSLNSGLMYG